MKFDFTSKSERTEAEWIKTVDSFWLSFTPKFFQVLEWLFIMGALRFIGEKFDLLFIRFILAISYVCLMFYITAAFYALEFRFCNKLSRKVEFLISLIASTILIYLFLKGSDHLIEVISAAE